MKEHFPLAHTHTSRARINLATAPCVRGSLSLSLVFSPCILLQPIRTYDYYQFVIIVAGAACRRCCCCYLYWFIYFNCTFAMPNAYRIFRWPDARAVDGTDEQEFRSICITVRPLKCHSPLSSPLPIRTNGWKHLETVRKHLPSRLSLSLDFEWRYVAFASFMIILFISVSNHPSASQMLNVSKDLNPQHSHPNISILNSIPNNTINMPSPRWDLV